MRIDRALYLAAALALSAFGCRTECEVSSDCDRGSICFENECVAQASTFPDAAPREDAGPPPPTAPDADLPETTPEDAGETAAPDATVPDATVPVETPDAGQTATVAFSLSSPAFAAGDAIPVAHSCRGADVQPELRWTGTPAGTRSLALVLIDDTISYVHWVAFDLPPTLTGLPEGTSDNGKLPAGAKEADAYGTQFAGPCPRSQHTYSFRLYALDVDALPFVARDPIRGRDVDAAFAPHILGEARLTGSFTP